MPRPTPSTSWLASPSLVGSIVFSLRVDLYEEGGFKEYETGLEEAAKWKLAELSEPYYPLPKGEADVVHRIWAYQVTA